MLKATGLRSAGAVALAVACVGCETLPGISSFDVTGKTDTVTLQSGRTTLTAAQTKNVVARLSSDQTSAEAVRRHLLREGALTGSPLTAGNAVTLLQDGPATYQAMLAAIESASDHINMETYIFDDDEVGQLFAAALIARKGRACR